MRRDEFPIVHMAIKDAVVKALEDVRAEIEADIEFNKDEKGLVNLLGQGKMMAVQIIDRKIKEIKHES